MMHNELNAFGMCIVLQSFQIKIRIWSDKIKYIILFMPNPVFPANIPPIILLTAKTSLQSKIEGLETGADAYIEKPFDMGYLQAQIRSLLHNRDSIKEYFKQSPLIHIKGMKISNADKDFISRLNHAIYENVADKDLNVDLLAKTMNMSRPTLYRKIKGLSDLSPNELIQISRLKKAAELLAEDHLKVAEVSLMVGYTVQSNFSRDFHKQFGKSPTQFVAEIRQ